MTGKGQVVDSSPSLTHPPAILVNRSSLQWVSATLRILADYIDTSLLNQTDMPPEPSAPGPHA